MSTTSSTLSSCTLQDLTAVLARHHRWTVLTGAGISTGSGIPDYRDEHGAWKRPAPVNFQDFMAHAATRQRYWARSLAGWPVFSQARPNLAHRALAQLEQAGFVQATITQNVDGLHQAAGSKTVYELHGSTLRNYCTRCGKFFPVQFIEDAAGVGDGVPRCDECGGIVKPDVVLYEEGLDEETMENAVHAIRGADTLIVGGTSLAVYPAAGLLRYFRGENLVVINKQPTPADAMANLLIHAPIGRTLDPDAPVEV